MLEKLFDLIERLIGDFSIRKLVGALLVLGVIAGGALLYERYTSSFRLTRIQRTAEVLAQLKGLDTSRLRTDSSLLAVQHHLARDLREASEETFITSDLSKLSSPFRGPDTMWRFLSGGALWWLIVILALIDSYRAEGEAVLVLPTAFGWAVVTGTLALFFPTAWSDEAKYLFGPTVLFVVTLGGAIFVESVGKKYRYHRDLVRSKESSDKGVA